MAFVLVVVVASGDTAGMGTGAEGGGTCSSLPLLGVTAGVEASGISVVAVRASLMSFSLVQRSLGGVVKICEDVAFYFMLLIISTSTIFTVATNARYFRYNTDL